MRPQGQHTFVSPRGHVLWQRTLATISLVLIVIAGAHADGQPAAAGPGLDRDDGRRLSTPATSNSEVIHYYGLLGPVAQPAAYSSTAATLTLPQLVDAAGGLTRDAAPLAHVIRNGRSGLQLYHSPAGDDRLLPGDVVVFHRVDRHTLETSVPAPGATDGAASSFPAPHDASQETIGIAFVGIYDAQPVVISLPIFLATPTQVIAALHQSPGLIDHVRVVRTSPWAPHLLPGRPPEFLVDGDVIVFDPAAIDYSKLAEADPFPAALPVDESMATLPFFHHGGLPATHENQPFPPVSRPLPLPELATAPPRAASPPMEPSMAEPAATLEGPRMPSLSFPENELPATAEESPNVLTTRLNEPSDDAAIPRAIPESPSAPSNVQLTAGTPSATFDFSANSYERLALASGVQTSHGDGTPAETTLAVVTSPRDPVEPDTRSIGTRATTLGITVLMIALFCFAASVIWSRFEDSSGPSHTDVAAEQPAKATSSPDGRNLERLIANNFPLIEEQTLLPERSAYHGEAVGRRRLRIDARQGMTGPHFAASHSPESATDSRESTSAEAVIREQHRNDTPAAISPASTRQTGSGNSGQKAGGLLERVLLAMEREKRR